jgi:hypothetical protein
MSERGNEDANLRTHLRAQTRWLAAGLVGMAALGFIGFLARHHLIESPLRFWRDEGTGLACAFAAAAVVTFALWPLFDEPTGMSRWRAALCGLAVVLPATFLWLMLMALLSMATNAGSRTGGGDAVVGAIFLSLIFGWALFPLAGCMTMIAAACGSARLRRLGRSACPPVGPL